MYWGDALPSQYSLQQKKESDLELGTINKNLEQNIGYAINNQTLPVADLGGVPARPPMDQNFIS